MSVETQAFLGERAKLYTEILNEFPFVRAEEVRINLSYLKPQEGEKILEIGSGSGLYTRPIAESIGDQGEMIATDPSADQLENVRSFNLANTRIIAQGADTLLEDHSLSCESASVDAIWSLGAFHHCQNKSKAFENFFHLLKPGGRVLICDVFSGSSLADYFDVEVARFSMNGHEVAFLTQNFASSLCYLFGFSEPKFHELDYSWHFKTQEELGMFMYKLHGMSKTTPEACLQKVLEFMQVTRDAEGYTLHVPLTILETYKPS